MEVKIDITFPFEVCPYCLGTGKLKVMQSAMTYEGVSVRVNDKTVKCTHCNGARILRK